MSHLQLVPGGPLIPGPLLQALEDERLVFFCGAGVSVYTGIPTFKGLTAAVYDHLYPGVPKTKLLNDLFDSAKYDYFLGELEKRTAGNLVRTKIQELTIPEFCPTKLSFHRALLQLARLSSGGLRMVTTNFDRRFLEAGVEQRYIDLAPKLPVPRPSKWNSLVFLHGLVDRETNPEGRDLVVATADYGRAYLTDSWASRFLVDLYREFTVVMIGYSASDPTVSYLVNALSAERASGSPVREAYAFAPYQPDDGDESRSNCIDEWESKGLIPILYDNQERHRLLQESIEKWAEMHESGFNSRRSIIARASLEKPSDDSFAGQVCWALSNENARIAYEFGIQSPLPSIEWFFDVLDKPRNLLIAGQHYEGLRLSSLGVFRDSNGHTVGIMNTSLIESSRATPSSVSLHPISLQLSKFLCRHITDPRLLEWVLDRGDRLHPDFLLAVQERLRELPIFPTDGLRKAWQLLGSSFLHSQRIATPEFSLTDKKICEDQLIEASLLSDLTPILVLKKTSAVYRELESTDQLRDYIIGSIELRCSDQASRLYEELKNRHDLLANLADGLTTRLHDAISLLKLVGLASSAYDLFGIHLSESDQHMSRRAYRWYALVYLVLGSFQSLYKRSPEQARTLVGRWMGIDFPLFARLSLHVMCEFDELDAEDGVRVLLRDRGNILWLPAVREECLLFLSRRGKAYARELEDAILSGPTAQQLGLESENAIDDFFDGERQIRLEALESSGADLSPKSIDLLKSFCRSTESSEAWDNTLNAGIPSEILSNASIEELTALISNAAPNQKRQYVSYMATTSPNTVQEVLKTASFKQDPHVLQGVLEGSIGYGTPDRMKDVWRLFSKYLQANLPETLDKTLIWLCSRWLRDVAAHVPKSGLQRFRALCSRCIDSLPPNMGPRIVSTTEPITQAINHPAGYLCEALYTQIRKRTPSSNSRNVGIEVSLAELLNDLLKRTDSSGMFAGILAFSYISVFFWIDSKWTEQQLISKLDWDNNLDETATLFCGWLWTRNLYPDLAIALKSNLIEAWKRIAFFKEHFDEDYVRNLCTVSVKIFCHAPALFSVDEKAMFSKQLDESGLVSVCQLFESLQTGSKDKSKNWLDIVKPVYKSIWPNSLDRQTTKTSNSLICVVLKTDRAFPDAVQSVASHLVRNTDVGAILQEIRQSRLPEEHPETLCHLLSLTVKDGGMPYFYRDLVEILKRVESAWTNALSDDDFKSLREVANRNCTILSP
ncbi:MAG: SIR2 family protein [Candidatus Obscuribacterales bacterium]|nr:SIR2 family protein [Candidatus Obscuribacterales bacterium]